MENNGLMVTQTTTWTDINGRIIQSIEDMPKDTIGFVYEIKDKDNEWVYIGKKNLYSYRTLPPLKGYKRKRKVTKESNWKDYYSSNKIVQEWVKQNGKESVKRTILQFSPTKKLLTYYENKMLYCHSVIEPGSIYLNDNISGKLFRNDFDIYNQTI